jgi:type IV secretion system protein VirB6
MINKLFKCFINEMQMNIINKILLIISLTLIVCSCNDSGCIDADDFGFPKITVKANVPEEQLKNDPSFAQAKLAPWVDTGFFSNGDRLVLMVKNDSGSRWLPWFGGGENAIPQMFANAPSCIYSPEMCITDNYPNSPYHISNAPCLMTKGEGLYALITDPKVLRNPNENRNIIANPSLINAYAFHLGDNPKALIDSDGNTAGGFNDSLPAGAKADGRLYFKILDHYYKDNAGSYTVILKSGVKKDNRGVIETVLMSVTNTLQDAAKGIYEGLIRDSEFIRAVKASLIMYIIFTGIAFSFGMIRFNQSELLIRVFKIAIIIQLCTTQSSWDFFNNHLFVFFTKGANELIDIMMKNVTGGTTGSGFKFFDSIIHQFVSYETTRKIFALMSPKAHDIKAFFVFILPLYIALFLFCIAIAKAVITYLMAFIFICIMIALAPIFLPFILFKPTRDFFNNWVKQMCVYTFQPLFIFIILGFLSQMILHHLHSVLGFRVCVESDLWDFKFFSIAGWTPDENINLTESGKANIYVPEHFIPKGQEEMCLPYECLDYRYKDLPYSPLSEEEGRVNNIRNKIYMTDRDTLTFFVLIWLLPKFYDLAGAIAKALAGAPFTYADLGKAASGMWEGMKSTGSYMSGKMYHAAAGESFAQTKYTVKENLSHTKVGRGVIKVKEKTIDKALVGTDKLRDGWQNFKDLGYRKEIEKGKELRQRGIFRVGDKYESVKGLASLVKDDAVHKVSGGFFGSDARKPAKDKKTGQEAKRTKIDVAVDTVGRAFKMKDTEQNQPLSALKKTLNKISEDIHNPGYLGRAAIIGSFFNPMIGGAYGLKKAYDYYQEYQKHKKPPAAARRRGVTPPPSNV